MSYVNKIIDRFGGIRPMAQTIGKPVSTVSSWSTRGSIPDANKPHVLAAAERAGIALRKSDFFPDTAEDRETCGAVPARIWQKQSAGD